MIKFTLNANKAVQTLLWILNKKPNINKYNIMKVMFTADCYHLNEYGRPIYGEKYVAMEYGTVPSFMKDFLSVKSNVPFEEVQKNKFRAKICCNMDVFSDTDIEALEFGISEYADLSFDEVKEKNHEHRAWKNHEEELKTTRSVPIPYEDMIENNEVLEELTEMGSLTEQMVF